MRMGTGHSKRIHFLKRLGEAAGLAVLLLFATVFAGVAGQQGADITIGAEGIYVDAAVPDVTRMSLRVSDPMGRTIVDLSSQGDSIIWFLPEGAPDGTYHCEVGVTVGILAAEDSDIAPEDGGRYDQQSRVFQVRDGVIETPPAGEQEAGLTRRLRSLACAAVNGMVDFLIPSAHATVEDHTTGDLGTSEQMCTGCSPMFEPGDAAFGGGGLTIIGLPPEIAFLTSEDPADLDSNGWGIGVGTGWFYISDLDPAAFFPSHPVMIQDDAPHASFVIGAGSGDVGLGTTAPEESVHIRGDSPGIRFDDPTYGVWEIQEHWDQLIFEDLTDSQVPLLLDNGTVGIGGWVPSWNHLTPRRPSRKLDIYDAGNDARIAFHTDLTGEGFLDGSVIGPTRDGSFYLWNYELRHFYFGTNNRTRMLLRSNGYLGIGPDMPQYPLHMASGARCTEGGVWTDASSREYKEDIRALPLEDAEAALTALEPVRFVFKADTTETHVGFIAEDVPDLVATKDRKGLSPMDIAAVLTKVVQEQQTRIGEQADLLRAQDRTNRELQESNAALEERVRMLEDRLNYLMGLSQVAMLGQRE